MAIKTIINNVNICLTMLGCMRGIKQDLVALKINKSYFQINI